MVRKHKVVALSVITTLIIVPTTAFAGAVTGGATFPEQIVQEVTAVSQLAKQAEEVETQISQYENMVQNMTQIPGQLLGKIEQPFDEMIQIEQQGQQLADQAQNIAQQAENLNVTPESGDELNNFESQYQNISNNLNSAIDNALQNANLNPSNFSTVAKAEQAVNEALANPQSRNALLQAGASIGQAEVTQLSELQSTVQSQENMQATLDKTDLAAQNANREANAEANNALYGTNGNVGDSISSGGISNDVQENLTSGG